MAIPKPIFFLAGMLPSGERACDTGLGAQGYGVVGVWVGFMSFFCANSTHTVAAVRQPIDDGLSLQCPPPPEDYWSTTDPIVASCIGLLRLSIPIRLTAGISPRSHPASVPTECRKAPTRAGRGASVPPLPPLLVQPPPCSAA